MGVYNTPKEYLKKAIDSIINQTFNDYEFIICDDGSTDGCFDYIKKMYGENEKVILICNSKNKGLTYTLNHCLSIAKGKYIARMDADDFSHCDRIEKQVKFLEENEEIGLVNCNINIFDDNGIYGERINNYIIKKEDFLKNNPIIHPAVLFKKSEIDKVSGYRDIPMTVRNEDYDLFMRNVSKVLKKEGIFVLHYISGLVESEGDAWMRKYIFPGGVIPSLREIVSLSADYKFYTTDIESLRTHYMKTLKIIFRN